MNLPNIWQIMILTERLMYELSFSTGHKNFFGHICWNTMSNDVTLVFFFANNRPNLRVSVK